MKTTLLFPSYLHIAGFVSVAEHVNIDIDLHNKALSADFNERDVQRAIKMFSASVRLVAAKV